MNNTKQFQIRPYARLLTMLGEQLIKNERIALIELIKNSYDADADWVKIIFNDFDLNFSHGDNSKIIIEDNGHGMTLDTIEKHWLNPATPVKLNIKKENQYTEKGRIIQGEKGIGRFALLKLGKKITITTRAKNENIEYVINYDFSAYDNDFLTENGAEKELFLDDLRVSLIEQYPVHFVERTVLHGTRKVHESPFGTLIEIENLKGAWSYQKTEAIFQDTTKLTSIFFDTEKNDFSVLFYRNTEYLIFEQDYKKNLERLLATQAIFNINGSFDDKELVFLFNINNTQKKISLMDPLIAGLRIFKVRFGDAASVLKTRALECGAFKFNFFIFDFSTKAEPKYALDKSDKETIRQHRIYLYRDGIRVYPYGEQDDDWLKIDMYRGTISAGAFLSNDQVVGYVNITQKENPNLKDKTNREGLIDEGNATEDFIVVLQTFLAYIRQHPYSQYQRNRENNKNYDGIKKEQVKTGFSELKNAAGNNVTLKKKIEKIEKDYEVEKDYLIKRAETTEELAGVGLSVETASHDIISMMEKVNNNLDGLISDLMTNDEIDKEQVLKEFQSIRGGMSFVQSQLKDIQLLFRSAKQRRRGIRISEIIQKVNRIYQRLLKKGNIVFNIIETGSPLVAKATDAVLLQLLLNLIDNAIYWLQQVDKNNKKITIYLDGDNQKMIFADNGPGIQDDDIPYIFEPFYSGKGEDGRGLGLYIARQLLERNDYSIRLAEISSEKKLSGANFVIDFITRS
jgi:signal transduction histidine kinase